MRPAPYHPHDELLRGLEAGRRLGEQYGLPESLRPCAAATIQAGAAEGQRNEMLLFTACELRRAGAVEEEHLFRLLREVNKDACRPALSLRELRDLAKKAVHPRADGRPYLFTCTGIAGQSRCLVPHEQDRCPWFTFRAAKRTTKPEEEFWRFFRKWAHVLTLREIRVYQALLEIEALRGVKAGTPFFASLREVAARSELALRHVKPVADKLAERGLFTIKPGEAGTALHKSKTATTWIRAVPPPSPPRSPP